VELVRSPQRQARKCNQPVHTRVSTCLIELLLQAGKELLCGAATLQQHIRDPDAGSSMQLGGASSPLVLVRAVC
jgi:hypothetical protein